MSKYPDITKLDWEILDALSDDYESIEQIESLIDDNPYITTTRHEILDRIEYLHGNHYLFLLGNKTFDRDRLLDEIEGRTQDRPYWFGRTEKGFLAWQELTKKYFKDTEPQGAPDRP